MNIPVNFGEYGYTVTVERGALANAGKLFRLDRRVLIVTDSGIPTEYVTALARQCAAPSVVTIPCGEQSKSLERYAEILSVMLENSFTRTDCVVALGGGVVGDLAGFAAASYMRGVDFYNVPTTLLSQIDSSVGGKTAVNFGGVKNLVGAFYQPRGVLIDPCLLETLPPRQLANGLAEALKMALTSDRALFELLEKEDWHTHIDDIIIGCINIKKNIVEKDEKESGPRRILNFGHTIGHGIESAANGALYHGECVALGMLPMCSPQVRRRLVGAMKRVGLPLGASVDVNAVCDALQHDKKAAEGGFSVVKVDEIGTCRIEKLTYAELEAAATKLLNGGFNIE